MPIAPVPDPLPDNGGYTIDLMVNDPTFGWLSLGTLKPDYPAPPAEPLDLYPFVQDLVDYLSAIPGAQVQAHKNSGFSREITPT